MCAFLENSPPRVWLGDFCRAVTMHRPGCHSFRIPAIIRLDTFEGLGANAASVQGPGNQGGPERLLLLELVSFLLLFSPSSAQAAVFALGELSPSTMQIAQARCACVTKSAY